LEELATAARPGTQSFEKILEFVLAEPELYLALRHLIEAIAAPHRANFHCARAMRNIALLFTQPGSSPERVWLTLRENLQVSKAYLQRIMQHARRSQADQAQVSDSREMEPIQAAWTVMNRLFEYLRRGSQPLPISEFPLLV